MLFPVHIVNGYQMPVPLAAAVQPFHHTAGGNRNTWSAQLVYVEKGLNSKHKFSILLKCNTLFLWLIFICKIRSVEIQSEN